MYNLPPPYLAPNMFSKSKKFYKNNLYKTPPYNTHTYSKKQSNFNTENTSKHIKSTSKHTSQKELNNNDYNNYDCNYTNNLKKNYEHNNTNNKNDNNNEVLFEILGLKIYFDDVLIICILLFLYQEGIHDEYLFIALILLLLS